MGSWILHFLWVQPPSPQNAPNVVLLSPGRTVSAEPEMAKYNVIFADHVASDSARAAKALRICLSRFVKILEFIIGLL